MARSVASEPRVEFSLAEVLRMVDNLHRQLEQAVSEGGAKSRIAEERAVVIEDLRRRMAAFRESFENARGEADRYQSELLEEIRRL